LFSVFPLFESQPGRRLSWLSRFLDSLQANTRIVPRASRSRFLSNSFKLTFAIYPLYILRYWAPKTNKNYSNGLGQNSFQWLLMSRISFKIQLALKKKSAIRISKDP
jgi:hypothetical protein